MGCRGPLAQGALKRAAVELIEVIDEALEEVAEGVEAGATGFAELYLPAGFAQAYDEQFLDRFRVCLVVVGYKLAQEPAITPGCIAEELALEVIKTAAGELLDANGAPAASIDALRGVYEICEDDDVLQLCHMDEPADAALAGHSRLNRMMGTGDLRIERWFDPFYGGAGGAMPHPICWNS